MKTVKIRVELNAEQQQDLQKYQGEASWIWNKGLAWLLNHHCLKWYETATKWSGKLYPKFDFDGVIFTPIIVGKRSAWQGVSCRIATGGGYFVPDRNKVEVFESQLEGQEGKEKSYHASKWIEGDKPYTPTPIAPYAPLLGATGKPLMVLGDLDRMALLNNWRLAENLPALSLNSDYVGGILLKLEASWKAFLNVSNANAKKPKFKNEPCDWLFNGQKGFKVTGNSLKIPGFTDIEASDRSFLKRLASAGDDIRSYTLIAQSRGIYICGAVALSVESELVKLRRQLAKAKKHEPDLIPGIEKKIAKKLEELAEATKPYSRNKNSAGFDPGIRVQITDEKGCSYEPNRTRERIAEGIIRLQKELDKKRNENDRAWLESGHKMPRPETKNEIKLKEKISRLHERGKNSGTSYNHKLSTRIARQYGGTIAWEDTDLLSMVQRPKPVLLPGGEYDKNGSEEHSQLTRRLLGRSLGQLKAMVETKANKFIPVEAANSSQICHCCNEIGEYEAYSNTFKCSNKKCSLFGVAQNGDQNAALNFAKEIEN
jgi:transposase